MFTNRYLWLRNSFLFLLQSGFLVFLYLASSGLQYNVECRWLHRQLCPASILWGKVFSFSASKMSFFIGCSWMVFIRLKVQYCYWFPETFNKEWGIGFIKYFCYIFWDDPLSFIYIIVNMIDYDDWCLNVKPILHPRMKCVESHCSFYITWYALPKVLQEFSHMCLQGTFCKVFFVMPLVLLLGSPRMSWKRLFLSNFQKNKVQRKVILLFFFLKCLPNAHSKIIWPGIFFWETFLDRNSFPY